MTPHEDDGLERAARERREADANYNDALNTLDAALVAAGRGATVGREQLERVATALIIFLQQITAFVESKDRELAAMAAARIGRVEGDVASLRELRVQVGVLTRATHALERAIAAAGSPAATATSPIA